MYKLRGLILDNAVTATLKVEFYVIIHYQTCSRCTVFTYVYVKPTSAWLHYRHTGRAAGVWRMRRHGHDSFSYSAVCRLCSLSATSLLTAFALVSLQPDSAVLPRLMPYTWLALPVAVYVDIPHRYRRVIKCESANVRNWHCIKCESGIMRKRCEIMYKMRNTKNAKVTVKITDVPLLQLSIIPVSQWH